MKWPLQQAKTYNNETEEHMGWTRVKFSRSAYLHFTRLSDQKFVEAHWLANQIRPLYENHDDLNHPFRVMDVGTGEGQFIAEILNKLGKLRKGKFHRFISATLIEPDRGFNPILEKLSLQLQSSISCEILINTSTLEAWLDRHMLERFDLILFSHVLYYFDSTTLEQVILKCLERLRPQGIICLIVCHTDSWLAEFRNHLVKMNPAHAIHPFITHNPVLELLSNKGISWHCSDVRSKLIYKGRLENKNASFQKEGVTIEEVLSFLVKVRASVIRKAISQPNFNQLFDPIRLYNRIELKDACIFIESAKSAGRTELGQWNAPSELKPEPVPYQTV